MDVSKFKTSDWLIVGGGAGMLIFGIALDWISVGPFSTGNAFDFTLTGALPWLLLVAAAVLTVLVVGEVIKDSKAPWPLILLAMTGLAAFLLLIRLIFNPGAPSGVSRALGMWLSVISGLVAAAGGFLKFTESGGDLKDLTDVDKLKAAFASGDSAAPLAAPSADAPNPGGDDVPPPPPPPPPPAPPAQ